MSEYEGAYQMTIKQLLEKGYAVTVFSPEELSGVKPDSVEEEMVKAGWGKIQERKGITMTVKELVKDLCEAILEGEDPENLAGKAAFLQAVVDEDWGSMDSYSPVYGEGKYLAGITKRARQ